MLVKAIADGATDEADPGPPSQQAAAGRLGGLKGGKARVRKLIAEQRREIAKKAAEVRWKR